jgi:hypothetical protein
VLLGSFGKLFIVKASTLGCILIKLDVKFSVGVAEEVVELEL